MISLQVEQLSKKYNRRTIFESLSFSHSKGVLGISGANGSGKSTLLKCLAQLSRPQKGTIFWYDGKSNLSKEGVKLLIGYAAPYINLYDELSGEENLEFLLEVSTGIKDSEKILDLIEYVQMSDFKDQLYKHLSTGQRQRIKLAAALIRNPKILFLDEPGSNLDEKGHDLVSTIISNQKEKGTLIVIASNDPKEIALCDNVVNLTTL